MRASSNGQSRPYIKRKVIESNNGLISPTPTLGVELELQILDRETGDLAPGALRVLSSCQEAGIEGVSGEFLLSMIEVKTGICRDVHDVRASFFPLLARVRNIASSLGFDLAIGGTHPFGKSSMGAIFPDERYLRIQSQQACMAYEEAVFGLHVHVGVPDPASSVAMLNWLVEYVPTLLALSANSPFWRGIDTGYASARGRIFRPTAQAGIPPYLSSYADFEKYCDVMKAAGAIESTKDIYWDLRPNPHLGTIEVRVFDAPATLAELLGLVTLTHCLVIDGLEQLRKNPELGRGCPYRNWLAMENRWSAARYGLKAKCAREPYQQPEVIADSCAALFERLLPIASQLGEDAYLKALDPRIENERGYERQRRLFQQTGSWAALIQDMKTRWARELDEEFAADSGAAKFNGQPTGASKIQQTAISSGNRTLGD